MEHQSFRHVPSDKAVPSRPGSSQSFPPGTARLLARILSCGDAELIWRDICDFFSGFGFEHVLYGYSPDSRGAILGAPEDYLVHSTLPQPVVHEMVTEGYFRMSVTFNWALRNVGVASWALTAREAGLDEDIPVSAAGADFFIRHGLLTGCTIGFMPERTRGRAAMALIAPPDVPQHHVDAILAEMQDLIFAVAAVAHRCLSALPYHAPGRRLTRRQREVLEWVAEGKTSADIAVIMGITTPTVEKHLRLARETLGVETTPHALVKATFLNQMFVTSPLDTGVRRTLVPWGM